MNKKVYKVDILLLLLLIVLSFSFIILITYINEKKSIIYAYLICNIINFILSFKIINIYGLNMNANIITSSFFILMTYLIIEKTNIKDYKKIISQIFRINIIMTLLLLFGSLYIGSVSDTSMIDLRNIFLVNYKILFSYPFITLITQLIMFIIYHNIEDTVKDSKLKIILTNLNVLMIETFIFNIFSYIFSVKYNEILILIITSYLIKVLITSSFTPLVTYLLTKKKVNV